MKLLLFLSALFLCTLYISPRYFLKNNTLKVTSSSLASSLDVTAQDNEGKNQTWRELFQNHLDWTVLEHGLDHVLMQNNENIWKVNLSVEEDLQKYIQKKLKKYNVDFGAVAAINPDSGAIVALTSYSSKNQKHDYSLRAAFPAASVFKVITAAAALEYKDWNSKTNIRYSGNTKYVTEKNSSTPGGNLKISFDEAFAKSINLIFGKIGRLILNKPLLLNKAQDFGFTQQIPFDMPLDLSHVKFDDNDLSSAKVAAGLGDVSLSPVHAAMIASCVINDGIMMKPYIVNNVTNENNEELYKVKNEVWKQCLPQEIIPELKKMMHATISSGTARKPFAKRSINKVLKGLDIGGKTGSKTNIELKGWNEWFVGYGQDKESFEKLAFAVVIVSQKKWKVKPAELSKDILKYYFSKGRQKNKKSPKIIEIRSDLNAKKE